MSVVDRVGDRVGAVEVGIGRVGDGPVGVDRHRAVGSGGARDGQRIAVRIDVVVQNRDDHGRVFRGRRGIVDSSRRGVVDRPGESGRNRPAVAIVCRDGDGIDAAADGAGSRIDGAADDSGVRVDRQPGRQPDGRIGQRIPVDVGECAGHRQAHGVGIAVRLVGDGRRHRSIVDRRHGDGDGRGIETAVSVTGLVRDDVRAVEIRVRLVGDRAVCVDRYRSVRRAGADHGERIAVGIGIVIQYGDHHRAVFQHRRGVVGGNRGRIRHGDGEGGRNRAAIAVVGRHGDGVDAAVELAGIGLESTADHPCRRVDRQPGRQACRVEGQRIAVDIGEIARNVVAHRGAVDSRLRRQRGVEYRRIVHRRDRDGDGGGGGAAFAIADRVGDGVRAVIIGGRSVGDRAVGIDRYRAVGSARARHGQRVAVGIEIVRQHRDDHRRIFVGGGGIVHRRRCRVGDGPGQRGGDRAAVPIVRSQSDDIDAAIQLAGGIVDRAADDAGRGIDADPRRQARSAVGQRIAVHVGEGVRQVIGDVFAIHVGDRRRRSVHDRCIVDRIHRDGDIGDIGAAFAIADFVGDRVRAVEIGVRRVGDRAIGVDRDRAVCRGCADNGQGVAVRIDVVRQHRNDDRRVLVGRGGIVHGIGRRVGDGVGEGGRNGAAVPVIRGDRDGIDAARDLAGRIVDRAADDAGVRVDRQTCRQSARAVGKRVAVHVGEIARNVGGHCACIHPGDRGDGGGDGRVVRGRDGHGDGAGGKAAIAIADRVGDRVGAVEIGIRHIGDRAVGVDRDGTVRRNGAGHSQRIAVDIGVVTQRSDGDRGVFRSGGGVRIGDRRIVDRSHGHADGSGGETTVAIADGVGDRGGAVEIRGGREHDRPVGIDRHRPVGRCRAGHGQRVAVGVAVVAQDVDRHRRVFVGRSRIVDGHRDVVHRSDRDHHDSGRNAAVAVADLVGDGIGAVEIRIRHIGNGAVGIDRDRAIGRAGAGNGQRVAIGIGIVRQHAHRDGRILRRRCRIVRGGRTRVGHRPGEGLADGATVPVVGGDGDRVDAIAGGPADGCLVVDRAGNDTGVGVDRQTFGQTVCAEGEDVAVDIGEEIARIERYGLAVRVDGRVELLGGRRVVHRGDGDGQRCGGNAALAIADGVGDQRIAVEIGRGGEGQRAVRIDHHGSAGCAGGGDGQRIAIGRIVVRQDGDGNGRVFRSRREIVDGNRRDVLHRIDEGRGDRFPARIGGGDGHRVGAVDAGIGIERAADDAGDRIDRQRRRQAGGSEGQRIAVHVGEGSRGRDRNRFAVVPVLVGDAGGGGCIVDRRDNHINDSGRETAFTIADRVFDRVRAVEIGIRHVGNRAVGVDGYGAVARNRAGDGQCVAIGIDVVRQHRNGDGRVFGDGDAVVRRDRRDIGHFPGEAERRGSAAAIVGGDGDGIDAAVHLAGRIVDRAGDLAGHGIDAEAGGQADGGVGQRIAVRIGEGRGGRDADRVGIVVCLVGDRAHDHGRIVHFANGNQHDGGVEAAVAVAHLIGDRVRAAEIGVRGVGDRTVGVDDHGAVGSARAADGQRIAVRIGIVRQHVDGNGRVFQRGGGIVRSHGRRVGDVERHRLRDGAPVSVIGGDGDGIDAAVHLARCRIDRAGDQAGVRIDAEAGGQAGGAEGQVIAVDVAEIAAGSQGHAIRIVDVLRRDGIGHGVVVDRRHRDRCDCGRETAFAVADRVGHGRSAVEIRRRSVDELVAHDRCLADGSGHGHQGQRIQVGIAVVPKHVDRDRRVFRGGGRIVHRHGHRIVHGVGEGLRRAETAAIGGRHGHGVDAVARGAALRGGIVDRAGNDAGIGVDCQARGQAGNAVGQRVARVGIGEGTGRGDGCHHIRVERHLRRQRPDRRGRIVDRSHGDRDGRGRGAAFAVADLVGNRVGAVKIGIRRIGDRAVGIDDHGAVGRGCGHHGQRIAVRIDIVRQHADGDGRIFVRARRVVGGGRHRIGDGIGERGRDGAAPSVARRDRHGVDAAVHLAGGIVERARDDPGDGIDRQARGQAGGAVAERITVDIAEGAGGRDGYASLRVDARAIGQRGCGRRIVHRRHGDGDDRGRGAAFAIADRVGDRVRAVKIGIRRVGQRAVRIDDDGAVARTGCGHGQGIEIRIGIVGQHRDICRGVFGQRRRVVHRRGRGVGDGEGNGGLRNAAIAVVRGHDDRIDAAVHLAGRIVERAGNDARIRIDRESGGQAGGGVRQRIAFGIGEQRARIVGIALRIHCGLRDGGRSDRRIVDRNDVDEGGRSARSQRAVVHRHRHHALHRSRVLRGVVELDRLDRIGIGNLRGGTAQRDGVAAQHVADAARQGAGGSGGPVHQQLIERLRVGQRDRCRLQIGAVGIGSESTGRGDRNGGTVFGEGGRVIERFVVDEDLEIVPHHACAAGDVIHVDAEGVGGVGIDLVPVGQFGEAPFVTGAASDHGLQILHDQI